MRLLQLTPAVSRHPVRVAPLRAAAPVRHLLAADVPTLRQRRRRAIRRGRGVSELVAGVALVHGDLAQGVVQVVPRAPVAVQVTRSAEDTWHVAAHLTLPMLGAAGRASAQ